MLLLATDITAFHIIGIALAVWAVVLTALGVTRHDFPGKDSGQTVVMAITTVLVVGAIGTAIATAKDEPKAGEEAGVSTEPPQAAPAPSGPVKTLVISADPSGALRYNKDTLSAPEGNVKITMNNPSPVGHNVSLEGPGDVDIQGKTVQKGGVSEVEAKLPRGEFTYYCSVPGHRQAGMQGTLTVGKRVP